MTLYAAYGSNLHPLRLQQRTPSARLLGTAMLTGFELSFDKRGQDGSGKCTIRSGGTGVFFAVYDMNREDKERLDIIEGVGKGYRQTSVEVAGFGRCATYVADPAFVDPALLPFCWYRDLVLEGAIAHGFCRNYTGRIAAHATERDSDPSRFALHRRLVDTLARTRHSH